MISEHVSGAQTSSSRVFVIRMFGMFTLAFLLLCVQLVLSTSSYGCSKLSAPLQFEEPLCRMFSTCNVLFTNSPWKSALNDSEAVPSLTSSAYRSGLQSLQLEGRFTIRINLTEAMELESFSPGNYSLQWYYLADSTACFNNQPKTNFAVWLQDGEGRQDPLISCDSSVGWQQCETEILSLNGDSLFLYVQSKGPGECISHLDEFALCANTSITFATTGPLSTTGQTPSESTTAVTSSVPVTTISPATPPTTSPKTSVATFEEDIPSSGESHPNRTGPIIGGVFGAITLAALITAAITVYLRRRRISTRETRPSESSSPSHHDVEIALKMHLTSPTIYDSSGGLQSQQIPEIKDVTIKERLGGGNFGQVFRGVAWGDTTQVALKKLKKENLEDFLSEASILMKIKHPNLLLFLGVFTDPSQDRYLVTEYCENGSLLDYFRTNEDLLDHESLLKISFDAAKGMAYLEENSVIHRDLAARNLLVDSSGVVKVADFGLSRSLDSSEYYKTTNAMFPVKWSAPEVINSFRFSSKSDCWSMGITLFEIFTKGQTPYRGMSNQEVIHKVVDEGYRMPKPYECPVEVWALILECLQQKPQDRPSLKDVALRLRDMTTISASKDVHYSPEQNSTMYM
eukprot:TRINITY_DN3917_c0_g1_i3.p1 TRINITY_DN3917_c0_g1~~TRINITY_DN3917_c0_g1_i3.p1  ORF type:complete len:629 (-),score=107.73 TRINITY_DN3917_c0_g1_i3:1-1887(-)